MFLLVNNSLFLVSYQDEEFLHSNLVVFFCLEMHKISTPRYQQRVQFPLDLLDENNENNRGMSNIEPSDSYVGEPTNQKASNS